MTDRKLFDLFYGARENDLAMCERAYETGADINFAFDGRRATKGGAGRWYYGDLQWYAPDGVNGDKKDTLLMIAIKINNKQLVEWMLSLDGLDATKQNGKGLNAMAVAKALGRENLLLGIATSSDVPSSEAESSEQGSAGASGAATPWIPGPFPPPPGKACAAHEAQLEIVRLGNTIRMLKVLDKEKEVIVMLHKIGRLEDSLREYTDFRQADADQYIGWGKADTGDEGASASPEQGS